MQKKLIALAVAGLVSAPVMAQSNVQIYGIMDLGFSHLSGSDWAKSMHKFDSGNQAASRIGFRGTEDLGNGLKAFFTIENGINADRHSQATGPRAVFLGLEGGFGRVSLGRHLNHVRAMVVSADPFAAAGVGNMLNINSQITWIENSVQYASPSFGGFTFGAAYATNVDDPFLSTTADETATAKGTDNANTRLYNLRGQYSNGPLMAGLSYETTRNKDVGNWKTKAWNLVGAYDFGVVKLSGTYGTLKIDTDLGDTKAKQWMLAATVPVSEAGSVLASYNRQKWSDGGPTGAQWAVGYNHKLSKRTNVYATYAKISKGKDFYAVNDTDGAGFTKGLNVGLRHNF